MPCDILDNQSPRFTATSPKNRVAEWRSPLTSSALFVRRRAGSLPESSLVTSTFRKEVCHVATYFQCGCPLPETRRWPHGGRMCCLAGLDYRGVHGGHHGLGHQRQQNLYHRRRGRWLCQLNTLCNPALPNAGVRDLLVRAESAQLKMETISFNLTRYGPPSSFINEVARPD